jgi:hypothetical protein
MCTCRGEFLLLLPLFQVMEDVTEGYVVTGLSSRAAKNATELRSDFNSGRANRDTQVRQHLVQAAFAVHT